MKRAQLDSLVGDMEDLTNSTGEKLVALFTPFLNEQAMDEDPEGTEALGEQLGQLLKDMSISAAARTLSFAGVTIEEEEIPCPGSSS